ncbi:MAG: hypothetical protein MUF18_20180 [Fimbriiglobus sp.]|jgi:hypothetical protein|nr:hypothetical protein [Fimbriiglobus sp.]
MPSHRVEGAKQLAVELPAEFVERFKEWVRSRGEKIGPTVMLALERHMAYPPPPPAPPPYETAPPASSPAIAPPSGSSTAAKGRKNGGKKG